jgi:Putative abortive phage resistance protein AbiGi, antitoxin
MKNDILAIVDCGRKLFNLLFILGTKVMQISSDSLFHFTGKEDGKRILKLILEQGKIGGSYCREELLFGESEFAYVVPMICFCDIPLETYFNLEIQTYGNYGIGLSKTWGILHKMNPVLYLENHSSLFQAILFTFDFSSTHQLKYAEEQSSKIEKHFVKIGETIGSLNRYKARRKEFDQHLLAFRENFLTVREQLKAANIKMEQIKLVAGDGEFDQIKELNIAMNEINSTASELEIVNNAIVDAEIANSILNKPTNESENLLTPYHITLEAMIKEVDNYNDEFGKTIESFYNFFLILEFAKPYDAIHLKRRNGEIIENYRFYDEMEWRYVPNRRQLSEFFEIHDVEGFETWRNRLVKKEPLFKLSFEAADIDYIVVESNSDVKEFQSFLTNMTESPFSTEEREQLCQKIKIAEEHKTSSQ